jgi:hypothetical protein
MTATLSRSPVPNLAPPPEGGTADGSGSLTLLRGGSPTAGVSPQTDPQSDEASGEASDDAEFGPVHTSSRDLPDPTDWSRGLVQVLIEVIAGHRPVTQLLRWTTSAVYDSVRDQTLPRPRPGPHQVRRRPRVTGVRACQPADGIAEIAAVVAVQHRVQALALRLEGADGRWIATALETS